MCHGVFDVVHPGHVRHLLYAKTKADILVASITADRHISKGQHRPHVPQELRALNLAAFEMIDYVIIDKNATPIENLALLQPEFFAKGYEYTSGPLPPKTQEEIEDRKSTRLNSSHTVISYAVFCLKKKKQNNNKNTDIYKEYL